MAATGTTIGAMGSAGTVGYSSRRGQNCRSTPANAWPVTFVATPQAAA